MEQIRVAYNLRNSDNKNILEDRTVTFDNFKEAVEHVKSLRNRSDLLGIPVIEVS